MSLTTRNMLANLIGQGWIALVGLLFVPFYLKFIGAEGYGLVGFFIVLSTSLSILDAGLGAAAVREVAKAGNGCATERASLALLLRTIEFVLWAIAVFIGVLVFLLAPLIAEYWLTIDPGKLDETIGALRLMGVALTLQFPLAFYNGCLIGRQRQLDVNLIGSVSATIKGVGAVLALWLVAPTVEMFFAWQCGVVSITAFFLRLALRNELLIYPETAVIDMSSVINVKGFALGVGGVNVLSFLLTQVDKIILSKILPIQDFGYYMLAWTLGTLCSRLVGPVFNTYYPQLTELVEANNSVALQKVYLKSSKLMGALVVPVSIWLIFYSHPLLLIWTQNRDLADSASLALMLIVLGTMFNAIMTIPYAAQLAHGWTRLAFWQNVLAVLFVVPATFFLAKRYGLPGAAAPWAMLNICYLLFTMPIMYRRLLAPAKKLWYLGCVVLPIFLSVVLVGAFESLLNLSGIGASVIALGANLLFAVVMSFYLLIWRGRFRSA